MRSVKKYLVFFALSLFVLVNFHFTTPAKAEPVEKARTRGTIIVDAGGGGDYTHIQWAIDNASAGDTIIVNPGTYYENLVIKKTLTLKGNGPIDTKIVGYRGDSVIYIEANWVNVSGFYVQSHSDQRGIWVRNSEYSRIENNQCSSWGVSIGLEYSGNATISNNTCTSSQSDGIRISVAHYYSQSNDSWIPGSKNNRIINNTCISNIGSGILIIGEPEPNMTLSYNNIIRDNICLSNVWEGILTWYCNDTLVENNTCNSNNREGIKSYGSSNNTIINNECISNGQDGIIVECASYHSPENEKIINNTCNSNDRNGINCYWISNMTLINNTCNSNNWNGIFCVRDSLLNNNTCRSNNESGIVCLSSNFLLENYCSSNEEYGIYSRGKNNEIRNNIMSENVLDGICVEQDEWYDEDCFNNTLVNNTCDSNEGNGIFIYGQNNRLENNTLMGNIEDGICLKGENWEKDCTGNFVNNNTCDSNNGNGIGFIRADRNVLSNNTCINSNVSGIDMESSFSNTITSNNCSRNEVGVICVNSKYNIFAMNSFSSNMNEGIFLKGDSNDFFDNVFRSNDNTGIYADSISEGNRFVGNHFFSNNLGGRQAQDNGKQNTWNNETSGNYWSDWTTPDADFDCIVDIPYPIPGTANAKDHFPMATLTGIPRPIAELGEDFVTGLNYTLTLNSSKCGGIEYITNYTWTMTYDVETWYLHGPSPNFTFRKMGIYKLGLMVKNFYGEGTNDTIYIEVVDLTPPVAYAGDDIFIDQHEKVRFDGRGSTDNIDVINYTWHLAHGDDNIFLFGPTPAFRFYLAGIHPITLNVTDGRGNWDVDVINIHVADITPPIANAGDDIVIDQHEVVIFDGGNSTDNVDVVNYTWRFVYDDNDDILLYGRTPAFQFHRTGVYPVTLTVIDGRGHSDTDMMNVTVADITPPKADAGGNITIFQNETAFFIGTESRDNVGIVNFSWTFIYKGKERVLYGQKSSFLFLIPGNYSVVLMVLDDAGLYDEDSIWVKVIDVINPIAFAGDDVVTSVDVVFTFDGSGSRDNKGIVNYTWSFYENGSLVELYGEKPSFIFTIPSDYIVNLTVTDADGNSDTVGFNVTVDPRDDPDGGKDDGDLGEDDWELAKRYSKTCIWLFLILLVLAAVVFGLCIYYREIKPEETENTRASDTNLEQLEIEDVPIADDNEGEKSPKENEILSLIPLP